MLDNKHSVKKEIPVEVTLEDFYEEMDLDGQKEFLTQQFENLDTNDQKEVAEEMLTIIPTDRDLAEVLKDKFFYLDESYRYILLTDIIDQLTTSQVQQVKDYLED